MTSDHVFGSDELTPDLLRSVQFDERDGRLDAGEVRTFLERVASSLDVFLTADAPSALRAEFARNAEIAQQVLDAGQSASEQLRRQAAEDAKRILDETRDATLGLRESVESEIEQARAQVEGMREGFIQDLRDLYDRIGASLYRFERAAEESHVAPIAEPSRAAETSAPSNAAPEAPELAAAHVQPAPVPTPAPEPAPEPQVAPPDVELPEGAKSPAWQQLPPEAWSSEPTAPVAAPVAEPSPDPFAVVEDEPLAPGEPLVDLSDMAAATPSPETLAEEIAPGVGDDLGGSWLSEPAESEPVAPDVEPVVVNRAHDDALAEALIAGSPFGEEEHDVPGAASESLIEPEALPATPSLTTAEPSWGLEPDPAPVAAAEPVPAPAPASAPAPAPAPEPVAPAPAASADASADAVAIRRLVLDALAQGQPREVVELYLRDQLGMIEPGAFIDATLATGEPGA